MAQHLRTSNLIHFVINLYLIIDNLLKLPKDGTCILFPFKQVIFKYRNKRTLKFTCPLCKWISTYFFLNPAFLNFTLDLSLLCIFVILAHPSCMNYSPELVLRITSDASAWQCIDCKACIICNDSGDPVSCKLKILCVT